LNVPEFKGSLDEGEEELAWVMLVYFGALRKSDNFIEFGGWTSTCNSDAHALNNCMSGAFPPPSLVILDRCDTVRQYYAIFVACSASLDDCRRPAYGQGI
jgi:hypothetical protein